MGAGPERIVTVESMDTDDRSDSSSAMSAGLLSRAQALYGNRDTDRAIGWDGEDRELNQKGNRFR